MIKKINLNKILSGIQFEKSTYYYWCDKSELKKLIKLIEHDENSNQLQYGSMLPLKKIKDICWQDKTIGILPVETLFGLSKVFCVFMRNFDS